MTLDIEETAEFGELRPRDDVPKLIREVHRAYSRRLQDALTTHDVGIGHWFILLSLWDEDGVTQRQLSRRVGTMEPTTVTALNALESRDFVRRVRNPRDRRKVNVFLTAKGRALRDVLIPVADDVRSLAMRGVPEASAALVVDTLRRIVDNLRRGDDDLDDGESDRKTYYNSI